MDARGPLALLAALLLSAAPAGALTLVQLSGSGDITIDATGEVTLDTGDTLFESITIGASTVSTGGTPGAPDTVLSLSGLDDYTASFSDDLRLEILSWTGTLSIVTSGDLAIVGGLFVQPAPGSPDCSLTGGGVIIGSGVPPSGDPCETVVIVGPPTGPVGIVPGPVVIVPGTAIPEPGAAVVFALGLAIVRARARRS